MGIDSKKIRFNVTQRGREHIGKDRKFDLRALSALVNGPVVQERVRNRDMVGYYGHWFRAKFGFIPPESVIVDGRQVQIEPAIVTTSIHADENGWIEHETVFLDTPSGKVAARLNAARTGGFSSAIFAKNAGRYDVPTIFGGFDYVLEPNFTSNRGYVFDSVNDDACMQFDSVIREEWGQSIAAMNALYDSQQSDHMLALETIQRLKEENEELLSTLARGGKSTDMMQVHLDSVDRPLLLSVDPANALRSSMASFRSAPLVAFEQDEQAEKKPIDPVIAQINRHFGVGQ